MPIELLQLLSAGLTIVFLIVIVVTIARIWSIRVDISAIKEEVTGIHDILKKESSHQSSSQQIPTSNNIRTAAEKKVKTTFYKL
jgi:hypothetical protein